MAVAALLGLGVGCRSADVLHLSLVHDGALSPERDFTSAHLRLWDMGDPDHLGDESVLFETMASTAELRSGIEEVSLGRLQVGHSYVVSISIDVRTGCSFSSRIVGRSAPFEHREGSYEVPVQVGCADELSPTRGPPLDGRLGHTLAATAEGGAVVAGGARFFGVSPQRWEEPVTATELYDASTGRFSRIGEMSGPRYFPGSVTLDSGEVVVVGGEMADMSCNATFESVWPRARAHDMAVPRCGATAVQVDGGVFLTGGSAWAAPVNELWDSEMRTLLRRGEPGSSVQRDRPRVIPVGPFAVVIGSQGDSFGGNRVEVALPDCGGGGMPCFLPVPAAPGEGLPAGWVRGGGVAAVCVEGGVANGIALYVGGGVASSTPGDPSPAAVTDVWCTPLGMEPATWRLRKVGELDAPRADFEAMTVLGPLGTQRLFIVGGSDPVTDRVADDALLIDLNPCSCTLGRVRELPIPGALPLMAAAAVQLADRSVLVVGGARFDVAREGVAGVPGAFLFFPAMEPP